MNHDFFNMESAQLSLIGALSGFLGALREKIFTIRGFAVGVLSGAIATPLFSPSVGRGLQWISAGALTDDIVWLPAAAMSGVIGVGFVGIVFLVTDFMLLKAGVKS